MKEIITYGLFALGMVLTYLGAKHYLGVYADMHPNIVIIIGLLLILGASKISNVIFEKLNKV